MKFIVTQKGEKYLVSNDTTGMVRGIHKTKVDAEQQAKELQKVHKEGIQMASARMTPKETEGNMEDAGE